MVIYRKLWDTENQIEDIFNGLNLIFVLELTNRVLMRDGFGNETKKFRKNWLKFCKSATGEIERLCSTERDVIRFQKYKSGALKAIRVPERAPRGSVLLYDPRDNVVSIRNGS